MIDRCFIFPKEEWERKTYGDTFMSLSHANPGREYESEVKFTSKREASGSPDNVHTQNGRPRDDHDHDDGGDDDVGHYKDDCVVKSNSSDGNKNIYDNDKNGNNKNNNNNTTH